MKFFTVIRLDVDLDDPTNITDTQFPRAFRQKTEAFDAILNDAVESWSEVRKTLGHKDPLPEIGDPADGDRFYLELFDESTVQWTVHEVEID